MKQYDFLQCLLDWARLLKRDVVALYLAARDRRVPWPAKIVAALVATYALSPVDLIPEFIPVLGFLDDAILVPPGILLAVRLIPSDVMAELREEAGGYLARPTSCWGAIAVVVTWLIAAMLVAWWFVATP